MSSAQCKAILLGEPGVGKTTFFNKVSKIDNQIEETTTSPSMYVLEQNNGNGETKKISLWDTMGQEKYRSITATYVRGCNIAAIFIDVSEKSFDSYKSWLDFLNDYADPKVIVVFNKMDLIQDQIAEKNSEIANFCNKYEIPSENIIKICANKNEDCEKLSDLLFKLTSDSDKATLAPPLRKKETGERGTCCH